MADSPVKCYTKEGDYDVVLSATIDQRIQHEFQKFINEKENIKAELLIHATERKVAKISRKRLVIGTANTLSVKGSTTSEKIDNYKKIKSYLSISISIKESASGKEVYRFSYTKYKSMRIGRARNGTRAIKIIFYLNSQNDREMIDKIENDFVMSDQIF